MSIHIERFAPGSGRDDKQEENSMSETLDEAREQAFEKALDKVTREMMKEGRRTSLYLRGVSLDINTMSSEEYYNLLRPKITTLEEALAAVKNPPVIIQEGRFVYWMFEHIPDAMKTEELYTAAVQGFGLVLEYVPHNYRTLQVCLEAVKDFGMAIEAVPETNKTPEVCLAAVRQCGAAIGCIPDEKITMELCVEAVTNKNWLDRIPWISRENFSGLTTTRKGKFYLIPKRFRTPELYLAAVKANKEALKFVPKAFKPFVTFDKETT